MWISNKCNQKSYGKTRRKENRLYFLDVKNNYDIEEKISNGNLNKYTKVLEKSYKKVKTKNKIENIMDILKSQIEEPNFIDKLNKIEDIINEK